jgi:hypothetical protein
LLGRGTEDEARALGTGIDAGISDPVLRIQEGYDLLGDLVHITSYNSATVGSGTVLDEKAIREWWDNFKVTETKWNTSAARRSPRPHLMRARRGLIRVMILFLT